MGNTLQAGPGGPGGSAHGGGPGGSAQGGGLYTAGAQVTLVSTKLTRNVLEGGDTGNYLFTSPPPVQGNTGGNAQGGGLYASGGNLDLTWCNLSSNILNAGRGGQGSAGYGQQAGPDIASSGGPGGVGGAGGSAQGGGFYTTGASLTLFASTLNSNALSGGPGGDGGRGGDGNPLEESSLRSLHGGAGGTGGLGGAAQGGGFYTAASLITIGSTTIAENTLTSAAGGKGGGGGGGGPSGINQSIGGVGGNAGSGGTGGSCLGGGLYASGGTIALTNSTISFNRAAGGAGGAGGTGGAGNAYVSGAGTGGQGGAGGPGATVRGGGVFFNSGGLSFTSSTIASNTAVAAAGGAGGAGGPGHTAGVGGAAGATVLAVGGGVRNGGGTVDARNTIFAANHADSNVDFWGVFHTAVHNLLRIAAGSNLVPANPDANGNIVGSQVHPINPNLGPLADNGGPTLTEALGANSPAINAGTAIGAPTTDQRGVLRDSTPDIGAYEYVSPTSPLPSDPARPSALLLNRADSAAAPFPTAPLASTGHVAQAGRAKPILLLSAPPTTAR
jgi:hypothetical protein